LRRPRGPGAFDRELQWTDPGPAAGAPLRGGEAPAFVPPAPAAGVGSLLARDLSATALKGLTTLAARLSAATILFDAIFVPSANPIVDEGPVPGRPDMTYRWARDEATVTFKVLVDGQQRRSNPLRGRTRWRAEAPIRWHERVDCRDPAAT